MSKHQMIIANITVEEYPQLTLEEFCIACDVTPDYIHELIEYGVFDMDARVLDTQYFTADDLRRVRTIVNLQRDLEVNLPGAALIVDLMEEIEGLRSKLDMLEKYISISNKP